MRKWMRDRLKRKKKGADEAGSGPKAAPLQPAYFEEQPAGAAEPKSSSAEKHSNAPDQDFEDQPEAPEAAGSPESSDSAEPAPRGARASNENAAPTRRRRRRGRGGRGRSAGSSAARAEAASVKETEAVGAPEEAVPSAPSAPAPALPRQPKGVVVLAIGLPGSGKSSWFKRHNITPLSSDLLRALLFDDASEQRFQDLIFSNLRSMLKARLIARRPVNYVDATNLTPHDRHSWIKLAKDFGYEAQAVFFDVPLEVCLERNKKRQRVVEEDVMRRFAGKLKPPTFEEGFSKITVVRVKQKDGMVV